MSTTEEMNGVEETKGDEPETTSDSRVLEDETPTTTTGSFYTEEPSTVAEGAEGSSPSTPALAVAYPVPLATEAEPAPSGGLTDTLSQYIWGKPKNILRQAKNTQKTGLPDTEETHE